MHENTNRGKLCTFSSKQILRTFRFYSPVSQIKKRSDKWRTQVRTAYSNFHFRRNPRVTL